MKGMKVEVDLREIRDNGRFSRSGTLVPTIRLVEGILGESKSKVGDSPFDRSSNLNANNTPKETMR
eukprot:1444475-Amphidinium_carterae.1